MSEYKKVLLCLDLTDDSEKIAERAKDIARRNAATITLLHVVEYVPVEPMGEALLPAVQIEGELVDRAKKRIAELAGAQPVTIQVAELAQAMATGAVNANITSGSTGYDTKVWEQIKYFYDTQAWLPKNVIMVSQKAFDALSKPDQAALLKVAAEAETRGWKVSEEKTKWYLEQLTKNGMTVAPPSPTLAADFKKIGDTITGEWLKTAGPDGKAIIDAYKK